MTWTLENAFARQVESLARLARKPEWRQWVAQRIAELEADQTGLWTGIREAVNAAEAAAKAGQAKAPGSVPQQPGKSL